MEGTDLAEDESGSEDDAEGEIDNVDVARKDGDELGRYENHGSHREACQELTGQVGVASCVAG